MAIEGSERSVVSRPQEACEHLTVGKANSSRVLVIIPAYNEQEALPATLAALRSYLDTLPDTSALAGAETLVVNDGSADNTAAVATRLGATVVSLPFNLGIGGAMQTGFRYAVRSGYSTAVQFDADGQHVASHIPRLVAALGPADLVIGSRFGESSVDYKAGAARRLAMRLLSRLVNRGSTRLNDPTSGFRAFGPRALTLFAANYPTDYLDSTEALVLARHHGLEITEVEVDMREREAGVASTRSWRLIFHYLRLLVVLAAQGQRRTT